MGSQGRRILDQEKERTRRESVIRELQTRSTGLAVPALAVSEPGTALVAAPPEAPELEQRWVRLREVEELLEQRAAGLEVLACDLADQRLHLAEHWERFFQTPERW